MNKITAKFFSFFSSTILRPQYAIDDEIYRGEKWNQRFTPEAMYKVINLNPYRYNQEPQLLSNFYLNR